MSIYSDLAVMEGVIAAGEYAYRGDRYNCPFESAHGWIVTGPQFTVCVMANVFCFVQNEPGVLNRIFKRMRDRLMDANKFI